MTVLMRPGPRRRTADVIIATSAPTASAFTTSRAVCTPEVAASEESAASLVRRMAIHRRGLPQLPGRRQFDRGDDAEGVHVEIGLVKAVEEHQPVGAGVDGGDTEVGERRVVRRQLHGERHPDLGANLLDRGDVSCLDLRSVDRRIGDDVVQVQFEGVGARGLELLA